MLNSSTDSSRNSSITTSGILQVIRKKKITRQLRDDGSTKMEIEVDEHDIGMIDVYKLILRLKKIDYVSPS